MAKPKPEVDPEAVAALKTLARKNVVSSVAKLHQLAQRLGIKHTSADLKPALEEDVGKQILAPLQVPGGLGRHPPRVNPAG